MASFYHGPGGRQGADNPTIASRDRDMPAAGAV